MADTIHHLCLTHNVDRDNSTISIQRSLNSLYDWGQHWKIHFEPTKTQRMLICRRRPITPVPILTFGDILKLLGITFDAPLSFRPHLHNLAVRANCRMGFLHKASRILDQTGRMTAYKGFIRPFGVCTSGLDGSDSIPPIACLDRVHMQQMGLVLWF